MKPINTLWTNAELVNVKASARIYEFILEQEKNLIHEVMFRMIMIMMNSLGNFEHKMDIKFIKSIKIVR
jgi:hypothetical protein